MPLSRLFKTVVRVLLNSGGKDKEIVRNNHRQKWLDGTITCIRGARFQAQDLIQSGHLIHGRGYYRLADPNFSPPRFEKFHQAVNDPAARQALIEKTLNPCLDYRSPLSLFEGHGVLSRQDVIEKASPGRPLWEQFDRSQDRFPGLGADAISIDALFRYNRTAAIGTCLNYGELNRKRAQAIRTRRTAVFLVAIAGVLMAAASFAFLSRLPQGTEMSLAAVVASALAASGFVVYLGCRAGEKCKDHARDFRSAVNDTCSKIRDANGEFRGAMKHLHTKFGEASSWAHTESSPEEGPQRKAVWHLLQTWISRFEHEDETNTRNRNHLIEMGYAAHSAEAEFEAHFFVDDHHEVWEKAPFRLMRRAGLSLIFAGIAPLAVLMRPDFYLSNGWVSVLVLCASLGALILAYGWADLRFDKLSQTIEPAEALGEFIRRMSPPEDPLATGHEDGPDNTPRSPGTGLVHEQAERVAHEARERNHDDKLHR